MQLIGWHGGSFVPSAASTSKTKPHTCTARMAAWAQRRMCCRSQGITHVPTIAWPEEKNALRCRCFSWSVTHHQGLAVPQTIP